MNNRRSAAFKLILPACLALGLGACTTESQQKVNAFLNSPAGLALTNTLKKAAEAAALEAAHEVASGNKTNGNLIVAAALDGSSAGLRATQDTAGVTDPQTVKAAVVVGSDSQPVANKVAPAVASAITTATATDKNVAPNTVNEAAAQVLEALAAKKRAESAASH
ncbi:MAG: hypothetical protein ABJF10_12910 [Chthoniobacter sp.]|uniref:hypothetical protein n=1 Tax=Chthoniobacter sp. TaxID=2510640 RepID=UPI0032A2D58B